ncbi:MAG: Ulp1 family isopeptidase [Gemmatimonadaceae bacterium]|jgi:hypothetical protein
MSLICDISEFVVDSCGCEARAAVVGGGRGGAADVKKTLEGLTATTEECAEDVARAPGSACASKPVLRAVEAFVEATASPATISYAAATPSTSRLLPTAPERATKVVLAAAEALECESESCVITHPAFRRFVEAERIIDPSVIDRDLEMRFKAEGPRSSTRLLNNFNIDETLRRWARLFPDFYPCPFAMMDFDRTREPFATVDILDVLAGRAPLDLGAGLGVVRRPARCFGCVVNTDTSSGPGKHWVAVFVDCRAPPWTVEYFNSAGNPPPRAMVGWMERTRARLLEGSAGAQVFSVPVTDMDHQESQTECGLYALFYIRRRLEGTPYRFFFEQKVPDDAMTKFRAFVFRAT